MNKPTHSKNVNNKYKLH